MSDELKKLIDGKVDGEKLSIINLDGGGAVELIDTAIADCIRNCTDLNMKHKVKREVVFKITLLPMDDNRSLCFIDYDVDTKLAKRIPISEGQTYDVRVDSKGPYAKSRVRQQSIIDNVTLINKGASK